MFRRDDDYADIMDAQRPEPRSFVRMPRQKRAAQFAPFAGLSGYGEVIRQTKEWVNEVQDQDCERIPDPEDPRFTLSSGGCWVYD